MTLSTHYSQSQDIENRPYSLGHGVIIHGHEAVGISIHGGCGVGKSWLLEAVAARLFSLRRANTFLVDPLGSGFGHRYQRLTEAIGVGCMRIVPQSEWSSWRPDTSINFTIFQGRALMDQAETEIAWRQLWPTLFSSSTGGSIIALDNYGDLESFDQSIPLPPAHVLAYLAVNPVMHYHRFKTHFYLHGAKNAPHPVIHDLDIGEAMLHRDGDQGHHHDPMKIHASFSHPIYPSP